MGSLVVPSRVFLNRYRQPTACMILEDEFGAVRMIYDLFSANSEERAMTDFCQTIFKVGLCKSRIEGFREIVDEVVSEQNINEFMHSPILYSMAGMLEAPRTAHGPFDEWMEMTRRLIALGADIHGFKDDGSTLTMSIITGLADHPFDSIYIGDVWLDTLRGVGVNDSEYLGAELMHDIEFWKSQSQSETPLILRCWEISEEANKCRISWDWSISSESSVFDVLNEFKHFGPTQHSSLNDYCYPENLYNWPYVYPDWKYCEECDDEGHKPVRTPELLERTKIRFERRQRKKVFKLAKAQGPHQSPNMPGGWID
jgi:hypothetical protein